MNIPPILCCEKLMHQMQDKAAYKCKICGHELSYPEIQAVIDKGPHEQGRHSLKVVK